VLPKAPFWAIAGRASVAERMGVAGRFHTLLPERQALLRHYRWLAPAYPALVGARRLPAAEVLLTSSYAFAHGFRTANEAPQIRSGAFALLARAMRRADRRAAGRVSHYVAESRYVAAQIARAYGREAEVIHPPVDCTLFHPAAAPGHDGYYRFSGRLIEPYKRPGIVIEAFRSLPHRLVVAGDGPAYRELKERAGGNVEFVGQLEDAELVALMQRCAATVFPSVDDFGLVPVETMACGGALETVVPGRTGEFFEQPTAAGLAGAVRAFEPDAYDPAAIRHHAEAWDVPRFQRSILDVVSRAVSA
jgi:glycosyltransferase involved in cell wall biosynthesis